MSQPTFSLCSQCLTRIPAETAERGGRIYLEKHCPTHGPETALLEEDAGWYNRRLEFDKPGSDTRRETRVERGCPFDCGICPEHQQHTCIGLLEITGECDLGCPVCYAAAGVLGKGEGRGPRPVEQIERMMDAYVAAEGGTAELLQLSGGEPTTHPEILTILERAKSRPFKYLMLNTNGLRIAEDEPFVDALVRFRGRFEVYLQFDGFERRGQEVLRGRDLLERKQRAIARLAERSIPVTLVATIAAGVNDHEVGRIALYGLEAPGVRGVNFQPLAHFGRGPASPGLNRVTLSGVLTRLEAQTHGMLRMSDFIPLPCDVERVAITFLYRDRGGFIPLPRRADFRQHLPRIANTLVFDTGDVLKEAIGSALSGGGLCNCLSFLKELLPVAPLALHLQSEAAQARFVTENTFRVTVSSFLDRFNFEARAIKKECVHVLTPDLRRIPFSAFNILHRQAEERR